MLLPSTSAWNVVKYPPNHVLINIIGLAQILHKIIEKGDVPILSGVLITPTRKVYLKSTCRS